MAAEPTVTGREPSLRPVRWPGPPRAATLLRAAVVAVLLTLAAGLLYAQESGPCPGAAASGAGAASATPAPAAARGPDPATPSRLGAPLPIPHGLVGVPVRLAEPAALAVVRPGGRVDLLAVPATGSRPDPGQPSLVAPAALVLDVLATDGAAGALLLALAPDQARQAVALPDTTRFAVILR